VFMDRRTFLTRAGAGIVAATFDLGKAPDSLLGAGAAVADTQQTPAGSADYTIHIQASAVEIAPNRIVSATTYNGQFPGPLLRFKEERPVTVDIYNDTDTPEQLHRRGQKVPTDVDGASEEGTPYIPAHGKRTIAFTPQPAGLRFYHTHNRAGADLAAGHRPDAHAHALPRYWLEPRQLLAEAVRPIHRPLSWAKVL
jgi:Multicopper oxidase